MPKNQVKTYVRILSDVVGNEMATKTDLEEYVSKLDTKITSQFDSLRSEVASEFASVRHDMVNLEHRLVIKLGYLTAALMTLGITATQSAFKKEQPPQQDLHLKVL